MSATERASLLRTKGELERELVEARARALAAERRLEVFRATKWGLAGEAVREVARAPWRAPKMAAAFARIARSQRGRDPHVLEGERLFAQKRYDEAAEAFERGLARDPANIRALQRKRDALSKMGSLTGMLSVVREMQAIGDLRSLRRLERALEGRLRELDTAWLPSLPGEPVRLEPAEPGRIVHLLKHSLPYHTNGYTVRSRYTLRAQRNAGLDPVAITSLGFPRSDGVDDVTPVEDVDGITHHRLDLGPAFPYAAVPLDLHTEITAWLAAQRVEEIRPALVHARSGFRGYETVLVGLALSRRFDLPVVYEISSFLESTWTADVEWAERGELYEKRFAQEVRCMREVDHVVTIADSMRDEIVARGIDPAKVTVIPNAVDAREFTPRPADPGLLRRLGLEGKVVIGYISNLGQREGLDTLIEATALLVRRGLPVACLIVGDGPERARLEQLVAELGVGHAVRMTGAVPHEQIKDHYAAIDIFVVPRHDDRAARWVTPLKPYEAMAMGKPLIVSALPALLEIADPPERGFAFEPGDAKGLAEHAERLIDDAELRAKLGATCRDWVARERDWDVNGRRYRELYERIIDEHGRRARDGVPRSPVGGPDVPLDELRADVQRLTDELDTLRSLERRAERTFATSRMLRVRALAREARAQRGGTLRLAARAPALAKRARRQRGASHLTPGTPPAGASHPASSAPADPRASRRDSSLLERGMEALRLLPATDDARPAVVAYYPLVRNNPFQSMLYSAGHEYGVSAVPLLALDALEDGPALVGMGADVWFHVHWTGAVLSKAESREDAERALAAFVERLDRFREGGGRVAWTVHNVLPHEHRFRDLEIALSAALAERSDLVHVLSDTTLAATEPLYTLPRDRVRLIPHASYAGVYPNYMSRAQARFELGLPADATVLSVVGGIRKYKGVGRLIDAFESVAPEQPDLRLVVAGPPIDFADANVLRARLDTHPQMLARFERIPENDLQLYCNAADAIVLPYEDILNSGVLMLAFTFGRPVIAARKGALAEYVTDDVGILFDPAQPNALEDALRRARSLKEPRYGDAALSRALANAPRAMAEAFARALREAAR